eukprot:TRINITY_DN11548_c0_g1_i1.p1 TRINITY_DN11548_c0_g1~~TRINITY_DN11548_c0_g1_i1.p1  ORF type:complete len:649 (+),score=72.34 TRINITY_DN11548_c0_g1_i1:92-2038(+)
MHAVAENRMSQASFVHTKRYRRKQASLATGRVACILALQILLAVTTVSGRRDGPIACHLGATNCCHGTTADRQDDSAAACCARAVESCTAPVSPLLLTSNWPAALGNIFVQLQDCVLLALALGRALVLPPVLGGIAIDDEDADSTSIIDLEEMANTLKIDIIVTTEIDWHVACGSHPIFLLEVNGGARAGPYRDEQIKMSFNDMAYPHDLVEEPEVRGDGIFSYELRGSGPLGRRGRWWGVRYPFGVNLMAWEAWIRQWSQPFDAHGEVWQDELGSIQEGFPLDLGAEQLFKQHGALVPILRQQRIAQQRCLVLGQLFQSVHWGHLDLERANFLRSIRLASDVRTIAERFLAKSGPLAGPYVAMHVRAYMFAQEVGTSNHSEASVRHGLANALRRALRAAYPHAERAAAAPRLFIAADDSVHAQGVTAHLQRVARAWWARRVASSAGMRMARPSTDVELLTSADTRRVAGTGAHRHVALDVALCARATAFVGTSRSSLSAFIAALRWARSAVDGDAGAGPRRWTAFWPPEPPDYLDLDVFPTTPGLPDPAALSRFFTGAAERVRTARFPLQHTGVRSCTAEKAEHLPVLRRLLVGGRRPHRLELRAVWGETFWTDFLPYFPPSPVSCPSRSEERRVGKACRSRWSPSH